MIRETIFSIARYDLAIFLQEHEEDILAVLREELQRLDDDIPEEKLFIDIKMVALGETITKAALRSISRFLTQDLPTSDPPIPDLVETNSNHDP